MLTEQQLKQSIELFTAAVDYNMAMHAAFVSTADMVEVDLTVNGTTSKVSVPTYHYLLKTVRQLSDQVAQLQIADDGSDVIQLLSDAGNLTLLYMQKQQFYVQPPMNAKLVKYDYETRPTEFSSADRTALFVDMTDCKLPPDALFVIARLDDGKPMQLPLQFKSTSYDKLANVLQITGSGDTAVYLIDSNDFTVGSKVQCNSTVYEVTAVNGQSIQLSATVPTVAKQIQPGDILYGITENAVCYLEVPISKLASKLTLQVQYMKLLSAEATYDVSNMGDAIHQTLRLPLADVVKGYSAEQAMQTINTGVIPVPSDIDAIIAASKPVIAKTTIRQTNTHQYIHSAVETMVKTNAELMQAKQDIARLEQLINELTVAIVAAGGDVNNNTTLISYAEQLASAKNRYASAQASLTSLNVAAQSVRPEYVATLYCQNVDSADKPIVQYVARYQYLSMTVKDIKNDWHYIYSDRRTVNPNGQLMHDIDNYSALESIELPIHAYEQVAVQVAAILQYGQPIITAQTEWTDTMFLTIPDELLNEVSIDEMFKNAYEAKLYTNIQQAMEAAGVFRHINPNVTYAHKAQEIMFDDVDTIYTKMQTLLNAVATLQSVAATPSLNVYVFYKDQLYSVTQGGQIELVADAYAEAIIAKGKGTQEAADALGYVKEVDFKIFIVNNTTEPVYLHTMLPGDPSQVLGSDYASYQQLPIVILNKDAGNGVEDITSDDASNITADDYSLPTETMLAYRSSSNAAGNVQLNIGADQYCGKAGDKTINANDSIDRAALVGTTLNADSAKQDAVILLNSIFADGTYSGFTVQANKDYPGIGLHAGFPLSYIGKDGTITTIPFNKNNASKDIATACIKAACSMPYVAPEGISAGSTVPFTSGGKGPLAMPTKQPSLFDTLDANVYVDDNLTKTTFKSTCFFIPGVHKYMSGRGSRGAFMFLCTDNIGQFKLPAYGTSNAKQVMPANNAIPGPNVIEIPVRFQARMTDRLGITDITPSVTKASGDILTFEQGQNFSYKKSINVQIKTGVETLSFDITMSMSFLKD